MHKVKLESMTHLPCWGGKKPAGPFLSTLVSWRDLISIQLPEKGALDTYLKEFFDSVDWFMMVM